MAWWLQSGVGHRLVQAVPHLPGLSLRLPTLDCLPHHLPGAYEVPIPGFQASGRPLRFSQAGSPPPPHSSAAGGPWATLGETQQD